jgi:subtilisin family serine protease
MILSTFTNTELANKFKKAVGLSEIPDLSVNITLTMVDLARYYGGVLEQQDFESHRYIIKIDNIENLTTTATLVNAVGDSGVLRVSNTQYHVVDSEFGLALYDELNGAVDQADSKASLVLLDITDNSQFPPNYQWGRLRLISKNRPFETEWHTAESYHFTSTNLVIMDSGINFDHREFEGLKTEDFYTLPRFSNDYRDQVGHGTSVASLAAGVNLGVNQQVNLLNCKVASNTHLPNALEIYNALMAIYNRFLSDPFTPMVVNMSWVIEKNNFINHQIENMIEAGIGIVCAAGNKGMDVSLLTPAGIKNVVTVAASDYDDVGAGFNDFSTYDLDLVTNHGLSIDIFAPGVDVIAASGMSTSSYIMVSGTSASAGYVSGCMSAIMSMVPQTFGNDAKEILIDYSTKGALLLDLDLYSYKQNNLAFLITADIGHSLSSSTYYLGYVLSVSDTTSTSVIPGNINQLVNISKYEAATEIKFNYEYVTNSEKDKKILDDCFVIHPTGEFTISSPIVIWDQGERLNLVEFRIVATAEDESIYFTSPKLIFFVVNPDEVDNISADISTVLESIESQSFFASWQPKAFIK